MSPTKLPQYRPWWRFWTYLKQGVILKYLATGTIVFGADYLVFFGCYKLIDLNLALSTGVAYIVGLVTNFILLRYWAFASDAQKDYLITGTAKYAIWLAINYGITYTMLRSFEVIWDLSPFLGKFLVAWFMTFWNYAGYKVWVFKGPKSHTVRFGL